MKKSRPAETLGHKAAWTGGQPMSDDETVHVVRGRNTYHTSTTCCHGVTTSNKNIQEWDREKAEAWGKTMCKYCSGEYEAPGPKEDKGWPI